MINTQEERSFHETETPGPAAQPPTTASACFPLSPGQERLWFVEQIYPHVSMHNIPHAWHLRGALNVQALAASIEELGQRHETLRTAIRINGDHPVQWVCAKPVLSLDTKDLSSNEDPKSVLASVLAEQAATPFELARAPLAKVILFRLSKEEHVLFLNLHHIIADEWSVGILMRELASLYKSRLSGTDPHLPDLPRQFADYAAWQRQPQANGSLQPQLDYWKHRLEGELPVVTLPADRSRPMSLSGCGATIFAHWPRQLADDAAALGRSAGATLFMTLMAAFKALLFRYTREQEVLVGTTFSGRNRLETEPMVGFFVNTHVLRGRVGDNPTFLDLLGRVREAALGAEAHQDVSLEAILNTLSVHRVANRHPLFQVMLGLDTGLTEHLSFPGLEVELIELDNGTAKFDLSLLFTLTANDLRIRCEYSSEIFERETIERFLRHFEILLHGALANPKLRLSELPLLTSEERRQVLFDWNSTRMEYPSEKRLHELFEYQASVTPDAVAVVCGPESITYRELNERAERVARYLQVRGVQPDMLVGLCLRRSPNLIAVLLGILKSGAAYLALDAAYPKARLQFMVSDAQARIIVTERSLTHLLPDLGGELVCIEDLETDLDGETLADLPRPTTTSRNLAYVIYTSGSTGQPKGVALEHQGAVALMCWAKEQYTAEELNGVLAATSVCFDLSVFEIFAALSWGGKVILVENALSLASLQADCGVTLVNTVPSALRELLELKSIPASVRVVNLAGEPLSRELVDRIYAETSVEKVFDLYGPTETTTYSTGTLRQRGGPETIGGPLPNERVYVLDPEMQPVPIGVSGELFIAGDGVARGYIHRPELTAQKFIADPFVPNAKMYRTGDLARWRSDGTLEYLGRLDHQVKLRGFRIELGEVQAAIRRHPAIRDVLVMAREDSVAGKVLVAYVVVTPGCEPDSNGLRETVRQQVPEFMVPAQFVFLPELPMTPNGKVDRAALPAPALDVRKEATAQPRTPEQETVATIWSEVLGRNGFGLHEDFFRVGGHSLLATRVISRITSRVGVELSVTHFFEHPTIAGLAEAIVGAKAEPPTARCAIPRQMRPFAAEELLKVLETLSEGEIEELLRKPELKALLQ